MTSRRDFLLTLGAAALSGCAPLGDPSLPPGDLLGMTLALGHRLRDDGFPPPSATRRVGIAIVGGGIAGLSAAWRLDKTGFSDFLVLELEDAAGGNSRSGQSPLVAYPWGAHYLPLPPPEAVWVRELLAEAEVLKGDPTAAKPRYDERYLCATPQERVFKDGLWQEGILPTVGLPLAERAQQRRFQARMEELKHAKGKDGRKLFALPMELSSRDPEWLALDHISFRQWLLDNGFDAPTLHWLASYACRDDFGTLHDQTSAWAGLHYFACRSGEASEAASDAVLTAPEGNGWLVKALAQRSNGRVQTGSVAWRLNETKHAVEIDCWLAAENRSLRLVADRVIWAAPVFTLPRVWGQAPDALKTAALAGSYAPWIVANLHLADFPTERHGAPLAWDNVLYGSSGLGYVVATHQLIRRHLPGTVLTYYRALADRTPAEWRQRLLETPREAWAEAILEELSVVHPDLRRITTRLDVFRHGHAMRRPTPGSLWGKERRLLADFGSPRLTLAHADLSGFSIFEEAQYRGVVAAERMLTAMGQR
ncbi:MAG: NAD(P)-binding protein [Betaproteobacteria bacterium]